MKHYSLSDIHGYYNEMLEALSKIDLKSNDKIIFLGDYIDYGFESGKVLEYIYNYQKEHKDEQVIVLMGNHEKMFLDWYKGRDSIWFMADSDAGLRTFYSLISKESKEEFDHFAHSASSRDIQEKARAILKKEKSDLITWMSKMPLYYTYDNNIYVHAGIDEEAEDLWELGTSEEMFLWKYPPTTGEFYMTIISGHTGTPELACDPGFHDIFFDGQSHYFIDGTVKESGVIPVLVYDCKKKSFCL